MRERQRTTSEQEGEQKRREAAGKQLPLLTTLYKDKDNDKDNANGNAKATNNNLSINQICILYATVIYDLKMRPRRKEVNVTQVASQRRRSRRR